MSKRQGDPQFKEIKKPKLNLYPSSQSLPSTDKNINGTATQSLITEDDDIWGDGDDEILLLASQVYEQAEQCDISSIANYTLWNKPPLTSTQKTVINADQGTSKSSIQPNMFYGEQIYNEFKKPTDRFNAKRNANFKTNATGQSCSHVNSKGAVLEQSVYNSNLNGTVIEHSVNNSISKGTVIEHSVSNSNLKGTIIEQSVSNNFNLNGQSLTANPVVDGQFQHLMRELRIAKAANDKLRHEHEMLTDENMFCKGEVSILRTQIKNGQSQQDAARIQRLKVEEKKQMVWNEKILALERENQSIKAQIEFKTLEESNLKERCRLLESSKIKLTEPVASTRSKWPSFSQKMNNSINHTRADHSEIKHRSVDGDTQTDFVNILRLKTNTVCRYPILEDIPKSIFQFTPSKKNPPIIFSSNKESLFVEHSSFSSIRKRILKEFNRNGLSRTSNLEVPDSNLELNIVYGDILKLMDISEDGVDRSQSIEYSLRVILVAKDYILKTLKELNDLSSKVTSQTIREMDEKHLDIMTNSPDTMTNKNIFDNSVWCDNEQAIDTRKMLAVVAVICKNVTAIADYIFGFKSIDNSKLYSAEEVTKILPFCCENGANESLIDLFVEICEKIGYIGCSHLYPGLLTSISMVLKRSIKRIDNNTLVYSKTLILLKEIVLLRPNVRVLMEVLNVLKHFSTNKTFLDSLCKNSDDTNMVADYSQGVGLYNSDTCFLQVLCCHIEVWVVNHSLESQMPGVFNLVRGVLALCHSAGHLSIGWASVNINNKCSCYIRVFQCLMVCLHRGAQLYMDYAPHLNDENLRKDFNSTLRSAILLLASAEQREPFSGDYLQFLSIISGLAHCLQLKDEHREALELLNANVSPPLEDMDPPLTEAKDIWEQSFNNFFTTD